MLDPFVEAESFTKISRRRNNLQEGIHITRNLEMHDIGNIFQSGAKLSPGTNESMGLQASPPNHAAKKFRLKIDNLLLGHKDNV